jgi:FkbM family methyltransferase
VLEYWLEPWVPQKGRVFVDVGANVGTWTRWLAPRFARVHAIEPNPEALPELRAHLPANAIVHEVAAWHCETILTFSRFAEPEHLSSFFQEEGINTGPKRGTIELPCCRIDSLGIGGPVDFMKCDTEGAEIECLLGAEGLIQRDRPGLLVEVHSSRNFLALARLLANWEYLFTIVRHPDYQPFSHFWYEHCWFSCQPTPFHSAATRNWRLFFMREALEHRLAALKTELAAGEKMLADMEARRVDLRDTLLRISGAIQVLEEELAKVRQPAATEQG